SIGFLVTFPLMFASSAFVPIDVLPRWLQVAAIVNPVTYAVNASRALSLDWPDAGLMSLAALLTGGVLIALAMTVAARKFATPWGEGCLRPPAPSPHHRHDHGHHHDREHDQPRVAEGLLDPADRCAGQGAGRHIHRGPRVGTTQRGGEEETVSHFRHARGSGRDGPYDGHDPRQEDGGGPVLAQRDGGPVPFLDTHPVDQRRVP